MHNVTVLLLLICLHVCILVSEQHDDDLEWDVEEEEEVWSLETPVTAGSMVEVVAQSIRTHTERANHQQFHMWKPQHYMQLDATDGWHLPEGNYYMVHVKVSVFDVAHIRLFVPLDDNFVCLEAFKRFHLDHPHDDVPLEVFEKMEGRYGCDYYRAPFEKPDSTNDHDEL